MTWITDDSGTRWVVVPPRKRRASPKGRRFADVKVGDWLEGGPWSGTDFNGRKIARQFFLVTDHWFDPVAGEKDGEKGMMFAVARLKGVDRETGTPVFDSKHGYTRYGLASQKFTYSSEADPVALILATREAVSEGKVSVFRAKKRSLHPSQRRL